TSCASKQSHPSAADRPMQARGGADADGWLCFEAQDVKRRLTPIPSGWWRLTDEELACLCERAAAVDRKPASSPSETAPRDA
ncbi:MAG TPA: hypothetical protein VEA99_12405, partial [Gemmatimonadaceae bacterium]|nr:hypothetical protein [Gemmatimonadaceae bacterium]